MSGLFGTYRRDKQPADLNLWERLGKISSHRGPDGTSIQSSGPVLLGHHALHTTTESLQEKLPYFNKVSGLAITADARIDNRDELLNALDITSPNNCLVSDSTIILLAYEKWRAGSFCRLIGDFSFVIWDSIENKVVCVRDSLGVKPFYYLLSDKQFSFSSEIKPLVKHPEASRSLNEGMIGEYLAANIVSKTETLYSNILKLAPGHAITISPRSTNIRQYWEENFEHTLRYAKEDDYVEHFQEIFAKAIKSRTRSHLPVSFELSGGLDSSSIVCMAHAIASSEDKRNFPICSLIYPGMACDETKHIKSVEKHIGVPINYLDARFLQQPNFSIVKPDTCTIPDPPNLANSEILLKRVQQNNSKVLLTGIGGDEWFSGSDYSYLDHFLENDYAAILKDFKRNSQITRRKTIRNLGANFIWPSLPFSIKTAIITNRRKHSLFPPWISAEFVEKTNLRERLLKGFGEPYVTNLSNTNLYHLFHSGYESNVLEKNDLQKAHYKIEGRHPFLDRRIVEFALSLPNSIHQQGGIKKYLLRLSGKKYLPTNIRNRSDKAEFSELYNQTFNTKSFLKVINNSQLYTNGWINKQILLETFQHNLRCFKEKPAGPCPRTQHIWFAFAISVWYGMEK